MQSKNGFVFLASYYEALKELDPDTQLTLYTAIMEYALKGNETELNGASKAIFTLIKPNIDSSLARYAKNTENGKQGGAPCGNKNAQKNNPKTTENNPNSTQKQPRKGEGYGKN